MNDQIPETTNPQKIYENTRTTARIVLVIIVAVALAISFIYLFGFKKPSGSNAQGNANNSVSHSDRGGSLDQGGDVTLKVKAGGEGSTLGGEVHIQLKEIQFDDTSSKNITAIVTLPEGKKMMFKNAKEGSILDYDKLPYEVGIKSIDKDFAEFTVRKKDLQNENKN